MSIYYPDNPILTNLLESIKKNSLDDYWRTASNINWIAKTLSDGFIGSNIDALVELIIYDDQPPHISYAIANHFLKNNSKDIRLYEVDFHDGKVHSALDDGGFPLLPKPKSRTFLYTFCTKSDEPIEKTISVLEENDVFVCGMASIFTQDFQYQKIPHSYIIDIEELAQRESEQNDAKI